MDITDEGFADATERLFDDRFGQAWLCAPVAIFWSRLHWFYEPPGVPHIVITRFRPEHDIYVTGPVLVRQYQGFLAYENLSEEGLAFALTKMELHPTC